MLDEKCIVVDALLENCAISSAKPEQRQINITLKGFSRHERNKAQGDVAERLMTSDAKWQIAQKHKKSARIDCYQSPARSNVVSARSDPRGSVPAF